MTTSKEKRTQGSGSPRNPFRNSPVALGCALLVMGVSAHAQQAAAPAAAASASAQTLDTVVVTGIRKGIEDAISVKRNSDGVVEAISAEDIGKLPDTTIADSLARLPGVTTQRTPQGNASTISIRGLGPDFNAYLLNGREQSSTANSRAVDLSVYPAELIGAATVYKTSDASLSAAGLAGTLDTRLIDPLSFSKRTVAVNYQFDKFNIGVPGTPDGGGHRKGLTYIDQFADRKIGLAIGYMRVDSDTSSIGNDGWGGGNAGNVSLAGGGTANGAPFAASIGGGFGYKTDTVSDYRDGLAVVLNYKPNAKLTTEIDYYRARIATDDHKSQVQLGTGGLNVTNATLTNGVITQGTIQLGANPNGLIDRAESIFENDEINSIGWHLNYKASPTWKYDVDLSHNSAVSVQRDIETYGGIPSADTLTFNANSAIPQFTVGSPASYTNPSIITVRDQTGWSGVTGVPQDGYDKGPTIIDTVSAARLDLTHDLGEGGMFNSVQFGANFTRRTKNRTGTEGLIVPTVANAGNTIPYPSSAYVVNDVGGTGLNLLTFNPSVSLWAGASLLPKYNNDILAKTWGVMESVTTGYVKGNIDTEWATVPVHGNVGLQLVNTNQSSSGFVANSSSAVTLTNPAAGGQATEGTSYTDALPSLNLTGDFGSGKLLRFGLSKQIARNDMTEMANTLSVSYNATSSTALLPNGTIVKVPPSLNATGSNPYLKPFKATALDLSAEKYFANKAYMSAAIFYKKLDTYTVPQNIYTDLGPLAQSLGVGYPATIATTYGYESNWVNGTGGNLKGYELAVSAPFNLITHYLDGFGASASYSNTFSSVRLPNVIGVTPDVPVTTPGTIPLPGLSKSNAKAMIYYEKYGFSFFVADNYRSTFVGSVPNSTIGGYPTLQYIKGSSWVSAQAGYEFQSGPAKGLSLRIEGNNLNNPTYTQLNGDGSINATNHTGHSIIFMASYKYQ